MEFSKELSETHTQVYQEIMICQRRIRAGEIVVKINNLS